jgi:hypothetical protein
VPKVRQLPDCRESASPSRTSTGSSKLAGIPAGFLAAGVGSRLAMRVSGFMFAQDHPSRFAFAESGAKVGEIAVGGSIFPLVFGTLPGVIGAYFYAVA